MIFEEFNWDIRSGETPILHFMSLGPFRNYFLRTLYIQWLTISAIDCYLRIYNPTLEIRCRVIPPFGLHLTKVESLPHSIVCILVK